MNNVSVKLYLGKWKTLKNGEHPILIRLTKNRKRLTMNIGFTCNEKWWDERTNRPSSKHPLQKDLTINIEKKLQLANKIILEYENENKEFNLNDLKRRLSKETVSKSVFEFIDEHAENLKKAGKIGNSKVYRDLKSQISNFNHKKDFYFSDISPMFLNHFEQFFREKEAGDTGISYYMRTLRALCNKAMTEGILKRVNYPFDEYKISKFNTKTIKRAITKEEMIKIISCKFPTDTRYFHSRNYFLFSFFNMGLNFIDLALLKWDNIEDGRLKYIRAKTGKAYNIKIQPQAEAILDFYRYEDNSKPGNYIFPILSEAHATKTSIFYRVIKVREQVNKDLKEISKLAGVNKYITTYVARHSWATISKRSGISTAVISEALGHADEKTTQIYLEEFEPEILDDANETVLREFV